MYCFSPGILGLVFTGLCVAAPLPDSALLSHPPHSQWGYALTDAKTGEVVSENEGHRFLVPASVVKLLTTAFAVEKLGAKRKFPTVLYQTGKIENGVLHGDLWIRGGGNPVFGSDRGDSSQRPDAAFGLFARALKKAGIREVAGNVYGDASLLDPEGPPTGAMWEDIGNYYAAAPSGLCFHDNSYSLWLNSGIEPPILVQGTDPKHVGIYSFQINAEDSGPERGDSCYILGAFWNTPRLITGKCPVEKQPLKIRGSLPDPAWTCARNFEDYLNDQGIAVKGKNIGRSEDPLPPKRPMPKDTVRLAEHSSPDLLNLISVVHNRSDNLYATQILTLAALETGAPANSASGVQALESWLGTQKIPNLPAELHLVDGNGLSMQNRITTVALAQSLSTFTTAPWFPAWRETLIGGQGHAFKFTPYAEGLHGKLWAKTGSMTGVSSLAGYIKARSGRILAFAVIVNHFDGPVAEVRDYWGPLLRAWQERY